MLPVIGASAAHRHMSKKAISGLVALALVGLLAVNYLRPLAEVRAVPTLNRSLSTGASVPLPWPHRGQGAVDAGVSGVIAATPEARPEPIASVAKVMTDLVVLQVKPLKVGEQGPVVNVTDSDVTEYQRAQANGESTVPVQAGEQLSEYQLLQALLIPSRNNIAQSPSPLWQLMRLD